MPTPSSRQRVPGFAVDGHDARPRARRARTGCRAGRTRRRRRPSRPSGSGRRPAGACRARRCRAACGRGSTRLEPDFVVVDRTARRRRTRRPTSTSASASAVQHAKYRPGKSSSASGPLVSPACSTRCTGAPDRRAPGAGRRARTAAARWARAGSSRGPSRRRARRGGTAAPRGRPAPARRRAASARASAHHRVGGVERHDRTGEVREVQPGAAAEVDAAPRPAAWPRRATAPGRGTGDGAGRATPRARCLVHRDRVALHRPYHDRRAR